MEEKGVRCDSVFLFRSFESSSGKTSSFILDTNTNDCEILLIECGHVMLKHFSVISQLTVISPLKVWLLKAQSITLSKGLCIL